MGSTKGRYSGLFIYRNAPRYATPEEAALATPEDRIASIWPYVVGRALAFSRSLKSREYANCDPEDTAQDLWLMLREKDHTWTPARGAYVAYARTLITRHLCTLRESTHTVESPRNSETRARQYEADSASEITDRRAKTYRDLMRAGGEIEPLDSDCMSCERDPAGIAAEGERMAQVHDAISQGVRSLTAREAMILGRTTGIFNRVGETSGEVAESSGRTVEQVKRMKAKAIEKVRARLIAMGHPAIASDN